MFRKLVVLVLLVVSSVMFSWSATVLAQEKEEKSKEAQIGQLKERMQELERALEREPGKEKAAELKKALQESRKKLERLRGGSRKAQEPRGEFPKIQQAIRRVNETLKDLRHAVKTLKEEGGEPEELQELQQEIGQEEQKLVKYKALLEKQKAEARKKKPRTKLKFFPLEHANAGNLSKIIKRFLTPSGITAADQDTNILIIKAIPNDLEIASVIVKNLDVPRRRPDRDRPRRRRDRQEGAERENIFFGKVLEAGKQSLTIETRDGKEKVTLYVPSRRKDDGTRVLNEELSVHVSRFEVGSNVRVQWRQGDERRFIIMVSKLEE